MASGYMADDDIHSEEFEFVLKELLGAFQPILEEDLKRAKAPEQLKKEAEAKPPSCEDEIALANRIFEKFVTPEVAVRLLPPQARELLGHVDRWRWCLLHIRCCIIFGWLVCRGPRNFRSYAYYLHRYWRCVREVLGTPVGTSPTPDQRQDFQTLVKALAGALKPYLTDQLASVEFPDGIPDEVLSGKIDCLEGQDDAAAIFDRLLTVETAQALLGKEAFAAHAKEPWFWFCRCWCLCAIRFGCCLARARTHLDYLHCLRFYRRCLRDCFRPLTCNLTDPHDCVEEHEIPSQGILRGVEIRGTAAGAFCDHYTLQWREAGSMVWSSAGVHYPGGAVQGACGVINGLLGYLETFPLVPEGGVEIQLCVYSTQGGLPTCCPISFQLQRDAVWIKGIEGIDAADPPGFFDPTAQLVDGTGEVRSFGTALQIFGNACVGGCDGRDIKRFTLRYQPGFVVGLGGPWTQFWQVDYLTPLQQVDDNTICTNGALTSFWREWHWPPGLCSPVQNYLQASRWSTQVPQAFPITPSEPPCPPPLAWTSTPLPTTNCQSGKYTLRLTTEDTGGFMKDDLQQVWFDNKPIYGKIIGIGGLGPCDTISIRKFSVGGGDCSVAWPASLIGIAFDELIDDVLPATRPNDNFDNYQIWVRKDGGGWHPVPIPGPGGPPWGPPFAGTSRVGDPGVRGVGCPVPPPGPFPPEAPGILALLDMRRLDAVCNPAEPDLTLKRGECCGFAIWLRVRDRSICPSLSGGVHQVDDVYPFCICNDLPPAHS